MVKTALTFLFTLPFLFQQDRPHKFSNAPGEIAFGGYDLVSYFDSDEPKEGSKDFEYAYEGIRLHFSSETNLRKFKSNPGIYLPEYDGWCAMALIGGSWVEPNYSKYKVQDGRLLFFEVKAFYNGQTAWEKDPDINKIMADKKYEELLTSLD